MVSSRPNHQSQNSLAHLYTLIYSSLKPDGKVVFVTGGAGTICSVQTKALVYLGANACIIGRNVEKTERVAKEIAAVRKGAKVLGIGAVDVRKVRESKLFAPVPWLLAWTFMLTTSFALSSSTASKLQWTVASTS